MTLAFIVVFVDISVDIPSTFRTVQAESSQRTVGAFRGTRRACFSPEKNESVTQVVAFRRFNAFPELLFHLVGVFGAVGETDPSRNADAVCIGNNRRLAVYVAKNKICRFASHAGEPEKKIHGVGNPAAVFVAYHQGKVFDIPRLGVEQSAGFDDLAG